MGIQHSIGAAIGLGLAVSTALAQQPPTVRVRGTIEQSDGSTLVVKSRTGETLTIKLADNARIAALVRIPLSDIKPGTYVGSAAVPRGDGTFRALEVHVFPEAQRGTGEGHRPFDLEPQSTMTNATVADIVTRVDGTVLTLKHKDGEQTIVVPPGTPIVAYVPGDRSELKPGARILVFAAQRQADGSLLAPSITVGRDGLTPPM
jgi:multidrug efflux pump subunit AcrA (membrane-fusion protein)